MIKVEHIEIFGFEAAVRGMRNPMNSWENSDSHLYCCNTHDVEDLGVAPKYAMNIGANDLDLMQRLYKGGTEHRKFMRQIFVSMDITGPLYWWKEFDTYKVGTTANSCSTMHKIHSKEFTLEDFSHEHLLFPDSRYDVDCSVSVHNEQPYYPIDVLNLTIKALNGYRNIYLQTKDKELWWQMIQLLPTSYNQKRTVTMTYENAASMIRQRSGHKLDEWREFVEILKRLPYIAQIMGGCTAEM